MKTTTVVAGAEVNNHVCIALRTSSLEWPADDIYTSYQ